SPDCDSCGSNVRSLVAILWGVAFCVLGALGTATFADAAPVANSATAVRAAESLDAEAEASPLGVTEPSEPSAASSVAAIPLPAPSASSEAPLHPSPPAASSALSPPPSPSASASAAAPSPAPESAVRLHDHTILVLRDAQNPKNAASRALSANQ